MNELLAEFGGDRVSPFPCSPRYEFLASLQHRIVIERYGEIDTVTASTNGCMLNEPAFSGLDETIFNVLDVRLIELPSWGKHGVDLDMWEGRVDNDAVSTEILLEESDCGLGINQPVVQFSVSTREL